MKNLSCEVINDLLPLYYDHICSQHSKELVEQHIKTCSHCQKELDNLQVDFELIDDNYQVIQEDKQTIKRISSRWRRSKMKSFILGSFISIGTLLVTVVALLLFTDVKQLLHIEFITAPSNIVKISQISQLDEGKIAYHFTGIDGYELKKLDYNLDDHGNVYITPKRPIIKKEISSSVTAFDRYDYFDLNDKLINPNGTTVKAIYFGSPGDRRLIWKEGMELPKATQETQSKFHF